MFANPKRSANRHLPAIGGPASTVAGTPPGRLAVTAPQYDTPTITVLCTNDGDGYLRPLAEMGSHAVLFLPSASSPSPDSAVVTVLTVRGVPLVSYLVPCGMTAACVNDLLTTHAVSISSHDRTISFPLTAALMAPAPVVQEAWVLRGPCPALILDDPSVLLDRATHFIADADNLGLCDAKGARLSGLFPTGSPAWVTMLADGFLLLITPTRRTLLRNIVTSPVV